jgi:hypothetical protein
MNPRSLKVGLLVAALCTGLALPASGAVKPKPKKKRPAAVTIKACASKKTGALRLRKRRYCRRSERAVVWSIRGPRGPKGARGASGAAGAPGANGASAYFSSLGTGYSSAVDPAYSSVSGTTPLTSAEAAVQTLSPAVAFTADQLAVRASAPPTSGSITVTLRANGADTALNCTIPPGQPGCSNTSARVVVPGGSTLSLGVTSTGVVLSTNVLIGFRAV